MALEIFRLVGSVFVDTEKADESIQKTDEKASNLGQSFLNGVETAAKWGAAIVTGATAAAGALVGVATDAAGAMDAIDKGSAKVGISKTAYQEWSYVLGQNGMDISKMEVGMKTLVSAMDGAAAGTASAVEKFDALGLSIYDSNGKLKDQETLMSEAIYALANMENGTEKARLATELFGKSGVEMMPMLNGGAEGIADLTQRAHDLGLVMSDEAVTAGVVLGDTMDDVKQSFGALGNQLGVSFMPIIQSILDMILANLPTIQDMFSKLAPVLMGLLEGVLPSLFSLVETLLPIIFDLLDAIIPLVVDIVEALLPVFVNLIEMLLPPIVQIVSDLLPPLLGLLMPLIELLNPILALLQPILDLIVAIISPLADLITKLLTPFITIVTDVIQIALVPLQTHFSVLAKLLSGDVKGAAIACWEGIEKTWSMVASWFNDKVIQPLKNFFSGMWPGLKDGAKNAWEGIKSTFSSVSTWFKDTFTKAWTAVKDVFSKGGKIFDGIKDGIVNAFKTVVNGIIGGINKVIAVPFNAINSVLSKIKSIEIVGIKPFDWVKTFSVPEIPQLYQGGVLERGQVGLLEGNGAEAVVPLERNKQWIRAVSQDMAQSGIGGGGVVQQLLEAFLAFVEDLPEILAEAANGQKFTINQREFARLVKAVE